MKFYRPSKTPPAISSSSNSSKTQLPGSKTCRKGTYFHIHPSSELHAITDEAELDKINASNLARLHARKELRKYADQKFKKVWGFEAHQYHSTCAERLLKKDRRLGKYRVVRQSKLRKVWTIILEDMPMEKGSDDTHNSDNMDILEVGDTSEGGGTTNESFDGSSSPAKNPED